MDGVKDREFDASETCRRSDRLVVSRSLKDSFHYAVTERNFPDVGDWIERDQQVTADRSPRFGYPSGVFSSRRRAASSTPRCWRICLAITRRRSPRERYPSCKEVWLIASSNDLDEIGRAGAGLPKTGAFGTTRIDPRALGAHKWGTPP
jgi:hypothetical protein